MNDLDFDDLGFSLDKDFNWYRHLKNKHFFEIRYDHTIYSLIYRTTTGLLLVDLNIKSKEQLQHFIEALEDD